MQLSTVSKLAQLKNEPTQETPFGPYQEEAIVSLALDLPEFFISSGRFLKPEMFQRLETSYVVAHILNHIEEYGVIPTRPLLYDTIASQLTEDNPSWEEILSLVNRKSNPREVPVIKDSLLKWAKGKAYGLIYSPEAQEAFHSGNYAHLEEIINAANRIADIGDSGFWFFEQLDMLFRDDAVIHRSTGFPALDEKLGGGPSPGEVLCFLAATNIGKSIMLVNNAISSLKGLKDNGTDGLDVLLVTFELDTIRTAMRCLGVATGINLDAIKEHQDYIKRICKTMQSTYKNKFYIYELPPDECSVNHIYAIIDNLKRMKGWKPDVVVLDYLELMVSRNPHYNKDDYTRQKHVSTEIRGLAKNEKVVIYTATQTNRSGSGGNEDEPVDLNKSAESYGKNMPLDYVVSLNQSDRERQSIPPRLRLYIAKNRNGPKHDTIECTINYNNMQVKESL